MVEIDFIKNYDEICQNNKWNSVFQRMKNNASMLMIDKNGSAARLADNRTKNKFREIVPYDFNRVILPKLSYTNSDYINASHIRINDRHYIVTQYPYRTNNLFWSMIWDQKSSLIFMLGKIDLSNEKYYFPKNTDQIDIFDITEVELSLFNISCIKKDEFDGFSIRNLRIFNYETNETREMTHIEYWSWPDKGVPVCLDSFFTFLFMARSCIQMSVTNNSPVIHCSAGAGRSGTFCLIDIAVDLMEKDGNFDGVDIIYLTEQLRCQRLGMVHNSRQLQFVWGTLIDAYQRLQEKQQLQYPLKLTDSSYLMSSQINIEQHQCPNLTDKSSQNSSNDNLADYNDRNQLDTDGNESDEILYYCSPINGEELINNLSDDPDKHMFNLESDSDNGTNYDDGDFNDFETVNSNLNNDNDGTEPSSSFSEKQIDNTLPNDYLSIKENRVALLKSRSERSRTHLADLDAHLVENNLKRRRILKMLSQNSSSSQSLSSVVGEFHNLTSDKTKYRFVMAVTGMMVAVSVYMCATRFLNGSTTS